MKKTNLVFALAMALAAAACGADDIYVEPTGGVSPPGPATAAATDVVTIYWTAEQDGRQVMQSERITRQQVRDLMARRAAKREAARGDSKTIKVSSALTQGSSSWTDCDNYEWAVWFQLENFEGNVFCSRWGGSGTPWGIATPFSPQSFDGSSTYINSLCNDSVDCGVWECRTGDSNEATIPAAWPTWKGNFVGHLFPVVHVVSQAAPWPC